MMTRLATSRISRVIAAFGRSRRAAARRRGQEGSAVVEFVFLGVMLLIPLVYLIISLSQLQAAAYATSVAAREGGRAFVTAPTGQSPDARADAAAQLAFADQGLPAGKISVRCGATPCLTPNADVEATAAVDVPLPFIPAFMAGHLPTSVKVTSSAVVTVDRFKGA